MEKQLLSYAKGWVLEVGVGTGDNFKYYPMGVSVTATNPGSKAIEKSRASAAGYFSKSKFHYINVDALHFAEHSFDTIVSTFSLCSCQNPLEVLQQLGNWCKPGGMILLPEYGISQ